MDRRFLACFACGCLAPFSFGQLAHNYDLEDVNWSISFNERARTIAGDVVNTLTPLQDITSQIALNEGKLTIEGVSVNGSKAQFMIDPDHEQMVITLPQSANKGDQLKVEVKYTGKPEAGVYFVGPDRSTRPITTSMVYTQGEAEDTRYWLPTYDEPDDKATSECHVSVPKGYVVLSNGALIDVQHHGNTDIYHWKIDQPHSTYLISFAAAKFVEGKEDWDGLPVDWYVPAGTADMGEPTFGGTADMVKFYSELTGVKYAYAKFAQCAVADFAFGGMENISAVTQTIDALHPPKEAPYNDTRGLVLHELAHQWFGDLETCENWPNIWLNEGFATFLPHFYFRAKDGDDEYQLQRLGDLQGALQAMRSTPRPMIVTKYSYPMQLFFDGHAYGGGAARMFVLMSVLGEKQFWKGIHQFLTDYAFKPANTDEFFASMSKATGQDLSWFEKQYFHTAALPNVLAREVGHQVILTQVKPPYFTLDLDFWELENGQWKKQVVQLHAKTATVNLDDDNDWYLVDPEVKYCAQIVYDYGRHFSFNEVALLYAHAPNAAAKKLLLDHALEWVNGYSTAASESAVPKEAVAFVTKLLADESSVPIRRYIASQLPGNLTSILLSLSNDPDPQTRLAAVQRLSEGPNSDTAVGRLNQIWESDDADTFRSAALVGLLRLTKQDSLAQRAWTMDSFDDAFRKDALDWWGDNNADFARETALAVLAGNYSENVRTTAIGVLGKVKDKPGEKTVFQALVDRLSDTSLREKQVALGALGSYGDKAAVPYIHKLTDYSMFEVRVEAQGIEAELSKS